MFAARLGREAAAAQADDVQTRERARSPDASAKGGTSCETADVAATIALSPIRANWWMPVSPPTAA